MNQPFINPTHLVSPTSRIFTFRQYLVILGLVFLILSFYSSTYATTISVYSAYDTLDNSDNVCTLREAIYNANNDNSYYTNCNAGSGDDTIEFKPSVKTICLNNTDGDLNITSNLTIKGNVGGTVIDGGDTTAGGTTSCSQSLGDRIFDVSGAGTAVTFENLTIKNGNSTSYGGGIFANSSSTVTLNNSTISGNTAYNGGGIDAYSSSTVALRNSIISGNTATGFGGGINAYSSSNVTLSNSTISENTASSYGGGIYAYSSSNVTLSNSRISENTAYSGGGIFANSSSTVTLSNSTISGNTASYFGGGIYAYSSTVNLTNSTVSGNTASYFGGGIYAYSDSTATLTVNLSNSTISGNTAYNNGGGIYAYFYYTVTSTVTLNNSTVSGNTAYNNGGGIYSNSSSFSVKSILLADNTASTSSNDCYGSITSHGYNLIEDKTGCTLTDVSGVVPSTDIFGEDPLLSALANNGGDTQTQALKAGSPAIDTGSCTAIDGSSITTDQRNQERDSLCDIGAYEYVALTKYYADHDEDGYGNPSRSKMAYDVPRGYVTDNTDCDDASNTIYIGATEICGDGIDQDCDGSDTICPPTTSSYYLDNDEDGYGDPSSSQEAYDVPRGYVTDNTDCNDSSNTINPLASDICGDGIDQDCNGSDLACPPTTPSSPATTESISSYYADDDKDGYGNPSISQETNDVPSGYVTDNTDCDDSSNTINPLASDICGDGIDQDCNGSDLACPPTTPSSTETIDATQISASLIYENTEDVAENLNENTANESTNKEISSGGCSLVATTRGEESVLYLLILMLFWRKFPKILC